MYSFCVLDADVEQKLSAMQDRSDFFRQAVIEKLWAVDDESVLTSLRPAQQEHPASNGAEDVRRLRADLLSIVNGVLLFSRPAAKMSQNSSTSAAMLAAEDRSGEDTSGTPEGDLEVQGSAMISVLICAATRASGPRSIVRFTKG